MEKSSHILETMSLPVFTQGCFFLLFMRCISLRVSSNVRLCLQVLFTLTFWLLVRQSVKENFSKKRKVAPPLEDVRTGQLRLTDSTKSQTHNRVTRCWKKMLMKARLLIYPAAVFMSSEDNGEKDSVLKVVGALVMSCYAKYWIFVCGGMFIMVSFAGKLVGYKIVYMLMFLICLCLYQVGRLPTIAKVFGGFDLLLGKERDFR